MKTVLLIVVALALSACAHVGLSGGTDSRTVVETAGDGPRVAVEVLGGCPVVKVHDFAEGVVYVEQWDGTWISRRYTEADAPGSCKDIPW